VGLLSFYGVGRIIEAQFEFLARYEVEQLERIDRSGGVRVLGFPDAVPLEPQQEMADGPIIRVHPNAGQPWVGVFCGGGYGVPPAASGCLIAWPDEVSLCVVYTGRGEVASDNAALSGAEGDEIVGTGFLNGVADQPTRLKLASGHITN
jgi:hypothetical protein